MTTLNAFLLERTMKHIENDPACWDQRTLGVTTDDGRVIADFPGWAVMLHEPDLRPPLGYRDPSGWGWVPRDQWLVHGVWAPAYAGRVLGVEVGQRRVFFHHDWGLSALRVGVDVLVDTDGQVKPARLLARMREAGAGEGPPTA